MISAAIGVLTPATVICAADASIPRSYSGDRLSGVVLPIEPRKGNINLNALKATAWTVDDTKRLVLDGDVIIQIAGFTFEGEQAMVWVNRIPSKDGLINQVAIWLPDAWHRTSEAGRGPKGRNLLVVGSARGKVDLNVALMVNRRLPSTGLLRQAETRLAEYLQSLQTGKPVLGQYPEVLAEAQPPEFVPTPGGTLPGEYLPTGEREAAPRPWLRQPGGVVSFSARTVKLEPGEDENLLIADGSVVLDYRPGPGETTGGLRLSSERAVVFMDPGSVRDLTSRRLSMEDVRGVYLEGAVKAESDKDDYVVRAPRMYYDFQTDRAIMLDAVLRTYDRKRALPVFARASEMKQIAENQWSAEHVTVSASSFATPTLAIGADSVFVHQVPGGLTETGPEAAGELMIDSTGNTLEAGGFPMLWWPRYSGPVVNFPLRGIRSGWGEYEGAIVETTWDFFSLAGWQRPDGWDLTFDVDGYSERGIGGGIDWEIETDGNSMAMDLYGIKDSGTQRTDTGISMDVPEDYRYAALWQQTIKLSESWLFQGQFSYISDSTYISAWREDDYRERREYETSLYLKRESRNTAFTVIGKYALNDFISNSWLIASQGYQVNKLPELSYMRFGDSLFGDLLTWSSQYNASRMQIVIPDGTPANSGLRTSTFTNPDGSPFGENEPIENAAKYQGLRQSWVNRLSTRQNISMPFQWGAFNITPFAMGQIVSYFEDDTTGGDEESRHQYYGSGGVRINTVMQRVFNDVDSSLFDLHRLRHLVEPYFLAWYSGSNYDTLDIPIYDPLFDNLSTGGVIQIGLRNTLQTQRGGPGRWYDVDWLTIDASLVLSTESEESRFPTPQFFEWEPGYSQLGNFAQGSYSWQFSDSLAFVGQGIWDLDRDTFMRAATGIELTHNPRFSTFAEYRFVNVTDTKLLAFGGNYEISDKYDIAVVPQWDFVREDFRSVQASVNRAFPDFDFIFYVNYDQVRGETRVGAQLGQVNY
ncbi:MAG: hypothetical protein CMJ24_11075 [Phycisphaerae bacterium]|nr:hypothetical protein [Phycisphaerae bacterium]MAB83954.1 hypothetical protein [Phycisphaerae bacterium]